MQSTFILLNMGSEVGAYSKGGIPVDLRNLILRASTKA
jgi:hypothetical protein